jgi:hydrogenase expression/formation protein HypE
MSEGIVTLNHGAGGTIMRKFVRDLFLRHFDNAYLRNLSDAAMLEMPGRRLAFTTDSYVVQPLEFPGGDVGKLAVCGTVNDLAVMGAKPLFLSAGFILEEGLSLDLLGRLIGSMAKTAQAAGVEIVTGDTKVVSHGECDGLFINTSGIGIYPAGHGLSGQGIIPGDVILLSGTIGEHGLAVLSGRNGLNFETQIESDCAPLSEMIGEVLLESSGVKWMRDATRGGVAAVLTELCEQKPYGAIVREASIPVRPDVNAVCELLGFDPLHLANEGKVVIVIERKDADRVVHCLQRHAMGKNAVQIGEITAEAAGHVRIQTASGGVRRLQRPAGELLPRIC